jgi:nicotinate phosphoribosyltransferase
MKYDLKDRKFWIANEDEIKNGLATDFYFLNVEKAMDGEKINPRVVAEIYTRHLPYQDQWGVLSGVYEALKLLEGLPVSVWSFDEGEVFFTSKNDIAYEPVMRIEGPYRYFARFETALLGFLCSMSGISTKAARFRFLAGDDKILLSFGTRRTHPALAPMIERCAYIAGFDGFSNVLGAELIGMKGSGTMPHSFILLFDDPRDAWIAFDKHVEKDVPRIALVDTYYDEKTESIMALETLNGKLTGIRLDTPSSRKGDWRKIVEEVKWELYQRGGRNVKILISGGIDEEDIIKMNDIVDGYGIGTSVSDAPTVDFNMKIVEVEKDGKMIKKAKRGDISGKKEVFRNYEKGEDIIQSAYLEPPENYEPLLKKYMDNGKIIREFEDLSEIRKRIRERLKWIKEKNPKARLIY